MLPNVAFQLLLNSTGLHCRRHRSFPASAPELPLVGKERRWGRTRSIVCHRAKPKIVGGSGRERKNKEEGRRKERGRGWWLGAEGQRFRPRVFFAADLQHGRKGLGKRTRPKRWRRVIPQTKPRLGRKRRREPTPASSPPASSTRVCPSLPSPSSYTDQSREGAARSHLPPISCKMKKRGRGVRRPPREGVDELLCFTPSNS